MTAIQRFIPTVGEAGFYKLLPPFTIEDENSIYTCKAVRQISEILAEGGEVFKEIYETNGLDADIYDEDVADDSEIIYLESSNNRWISVPSRYLLGYPNMNGIPYHRVNIAITLPAFPVNHNYENALEQIQEIVGMTLGVECETNVVIVSKAILVEDSKHQVIDANRKSEMVKSTPSARANFWRTSYDNLLVRYNAIIATLV